MLKRSLFHFAFCQILSYPIYFAVVSICILTLSCYTDLTTSSINILFGKRIHITSLLPTVMIEGRILTHNPKETKKNSQWLDSIDSNNITFMKAHIANDLEGQHELYSRHIEQVLRRCPNRPYIMEITNIWNNQIFNFKAAATTLIYIYI